MQRQKLRVFLSDFDECLTHFATDKSPNRIGRTVYEAGLSRCKTPVQRKAYLAQNMKPRVAELFSRILNTDSCVAGIVTFSNDPETVKEHLLAAGLTTEEINQIKFRFRPNNFNPDASKKDDMVLEILDEIGRENIECVYFADDTERHVEDVKLCLTNHKIPCHAILVPRGFKKDKPDVKELNFIDQFIEIAGTHIKHIPKDVINYMLGFADPASVLAFSETCRFFSTTTAVTRETAKNKLRNDVHATMRRVKPEKAELQGLNCVLFGNVNTGKHEIIYSYEKFYHTLAASYEFTTSIISAGPIELTLNLWNTARKDIVAKSQILVACATTNFDDSVAEDVIALVLTPVRIQLMKIDDSNPNAIKVVLINAEKKSELTTDQMTIISDTLKNEFGPDLMCQQVDTKTGKGIKEALDSAVAAALIKRYHSQQRQPQRSSKCTIM